jgi:hypothetical protein
MIRIYDPQLPDIVLNHPDVRPTVEKGAGYISIADHIRDPRNVVFAWPYGFVLFIYKAEGEYEGHVAFLPHGRGATALAAVRSAIDRLFADHGCRVIRAAVPQVLPQVGFLVRRLGFAFEGADPEKPVDHFVMEAEKWAV